MNNDINNIYQIKEELTTLSAPYFTESHLQPEISHHFPVLFKEEPTLEELSKTWENLQRVLNLCQNQISKKLRVYISEFRSYYGSSLATQVKATFQEFDKEWGTDCYRGFLKVEKTIVKESQTLEELSQAACTLTKMESAVLKNIREWEERAASLELEYCQIQLDEVCSKINSLNNLSPEQLLKTAELFHKVCNLTAASHFIYFEKGLAILNEMIENGTLLNQAYQLRSSYLLMMYNHYGLMVQNKSTELINSELILDQEISLQELYEATREGVTKFMKDSSFNFSSITFPSKKQILNFGEHRSPEDEYTFHSSYLMAYAIKDLYNASLVTSDKLPIFQQLSKLYISLKNYTKAIEILSQAIEIYPKEVALYITKANCHQSLGNFSEAANEYENLYKSDPKNVNVAYQLVKCYNKLLLFPKAVKLGEAAIKTCPKDQQELLKKLNSLVKTAKKRLYFESDSISEQMANCITTSPLYDEAKKLCLNKCYTEARQVCNKAIESLTHDTSLHPSYTNVLRIGDTDPFNNSEEAQNIRKDHSLAQLGQEVISWINVEDDNKAISSKYGTYWNVFSTYKNAPEKAITSLSSWIKGNCQETAVDSALRDNGDRAIHKTDRSTKQKIYQEYLFEKTHDSSFQFFYRLLDQWVFNNNSSSMLEPGWDVYYKVFAELVHKKKLHVLDSIISGEKLTDKKIQSCISSKMTHEDEFWNSFPKRVNSESFYHLCRGIFQLYPGFTGSIQAICERDAEGDIFLYRLKLTFLQHICQQFTNISEHNDDYKSAMKSYFVLNSILQAKIDTLICDIEKKKATARVEERNKVIADLSHHIKNLVGSVIDPLENLHNGQEYSSKIVADALRGTNLIREAVNAMNLSHIGALDDFIHDAVHATDSTSQSLEELLTQALMGAISNMFDAKYYAKTMKNYYPTREAFTKAKQGWSGVTKSSLDQIMNFCREFMFDFEVNIADVIDYNIGGEKGSSLKLLIFFQEIMLNAVKYSSFVPRQDRKISVCFINVNDKIRVSVTNSLKQSNAAKTSGLGHEIINSFSKILKAKKEVIETAQNYELTLLIPNLWKEL